MAKLPGNPITYTPSGTSDTVDGTTAFPGAMRALINLIPDPSTKGLWSPRPASLLKENVPQSNADVPSALLVVGDLAYGMVPSSLNPGHDEPFLCNLATNSWIPVSGITAGNTPVTQPSSGDWTPPIMAQVGTRVIVTHPGFPGGTVKFGWFDVSNTQISIFGDLTTVAGVNRFITGFFSVFGVEPGLSVVAPDIPAGTVVTQTFENASVGFVTNGTVTEGSITVSVADLNGFRLGSILSGRGIQPGATITSRSDVAGAGTFTMSAPGVATATGEIIAVVPVSQVPAVTTTAGSNAATWTVDGGGSTANYFATGQLIQSANIPPTMIDSALPFGIGTLTLHDNATISGTAPVVLSGSLVLMSAAATSIIAHESITFSGGLPAAPLWSAGDCDRNQLPSVPRGVAQFNGRAYYACGKDGIVFSDPLQPCRRTNANQALTTNDGFDVTAVAPLMLSAPIVGGIVQALIAFEGSNQMRQITGDPVTNNLAMNLLPVATGTDAPLSIVPTEKGLAFISPDGLRFIDFAGNVTSPVGDFGQGIVVPFHNAIAPSRICGAATSSVLRFTIQNGAADGAPFQEWWYQLPPRGVDPMLGFWHGPHTFPAALIQRWRNQCLLAAVGIPGQLWSSTVVPAASDTYVENGQILTCISETVLLPDNQQLGMNKMVEANLACSGSLQINYQVVDEYDTPLDYVGVPIPSDGSGAFRQRPVKFHRPIIFKQMRVVVTAQADQALRLGNFYWRWQILPYNIQPVAPITNFASL